MPVFQPGELWDTYAPMPNPYSDRDPGLRRMAGLMRNPLDPFANIRHILDIQKPPHQYVTPEQEKQALAIAAPGQESAMQKIGYYIDKVVGARAARAAVDTALGGDHARDILSFIPGSDVLGITDPKDRVWFKDTLKRTGNWTDRPGKIDPVDAWGLAGDILLDPTLPLSGFIKGGLTGAGKALKYAGGLKDVEYALATKALQAGKKIGTLGARKTTTVGAGLDTLRNLDPMSALLIENRMLNRAGAAGLAAMKTKPIGRSMEFGIPFTSKGVGFNVPFLDPIRDKLFGAISSSYPVRGMMRHLHAPSGEMSTGAGQLLSRQVANRAARATDVTEPLARKAAELIASKEWDDIAKRKEWFQWIEGFVPPPAAHDELVRYLRTQLNTAGAERGRMTIGHMLEDKFISGGNFTPRNMFKNPEHADDVMLQYQKLAAKSTDPARRAALKDIPGGSATLMEMFSDPALLAFHKNRNLWKEIKSWFGGRGHLGVMPHGDSQFRTMARIMRATDIDILKQGFFIHPLESAARYLTKHSARSAVANAQLDMVAAGSGAMRGKPAAATTTTFKDMFKVANIGGEKRLQTAMSRYANPKFEFGKPSPFENGAYPEYVARYLKGTPEHADLTRLQGEWTAFSAMPAGPARNAMRRRLATEGKKLYGDIGNIAVDEKIMKDVLRWENMTRSTKSSGDLLKFYDSLNNHFKAFVLNWPARYTRDIVSGQIMNMFLGMWKASAAKDSLSFFRTGKFPNARKYLGPILPAAKIAAMTDDDASRAYVTHLHHQGLLQLSETKAGMYGKFVEPNTLEHRMRDMLKWETPMPFGKSGAYIKDTKQLFKDPQAWNIFHLKGMWGHDETKFVPARWGETASRFTDGMNRIVPYSVQLSKGIAPNEAIRRVIQAQVSYANKSYTSFEKAFMMRVFPFYRFTRGILPTVGGELANRPAGAMAQAIRRAGDASRGQEFMPQHITQTMALPLTGGAGTDEPGYQRYLTDLGMMHEDPIKLFRPGQGIAKTIAGSLAEIGSRTSPVIKMPIELMTGTQLYSGRRLQDLDPVLGRIKANIHQRRTGEKVIPQRIVSPEVENLLMNSPASRAIGTLGALLDTRQGAGPKALRTLTGVRLQDVDYAKAKNMVVREALEDLLEGRPGVRALRPHLYTKPEEREMLNPTDRLLMDLYNQQRLDWERLQKERGLQR